MSIMDHRSETSARLLEMRTLGNHARRRITYVGAALLLTTGPLLGGGSASLPVSAKSSEWSLADVSRLVIEVPRVYEVALSPDGMSVAYTVVRGTVETNLQTSELLLQALDSDGSPRGAPKRLAQASSSSSKTQFRPQWRPDGRVLSYHTTLQETLTRTESSEPSGDAGSSSGSTKRPVLVAYDVQSGSISPIEVRKLSRPTSALCTGDCTPPSVGIGSGYRWSSTGRFIAFLGAVGTRAKLDPTRGMVQTPELLWRGGQRDGLYVLDVASGTVQQLTPDTMSVHAFDWSPDESEIVISATESQQYRYRDGDTLRIVELATGAVRTLVPKPGSYMALGWSPDGKWIVFGDQPQGNVLLGHYFPSVVSVKSPDDVVVLANDGEPLMYAYDRPSWTADSRAFYYHSAHHLTGELVRADIVERRVATVFPEDTYSDRTFSFSADSTRAAFGRSSLTSPWELSVTALPHGTPRAITDFESSFALRTIARIERVSWPSQDGKFTVHGLLMTPKTAWRADGSAMESPLPTIVFNTGGPSMVWSSIDTDSYNGLALTLAARGYAVLIPNTRCRGGYGTAFKRATEDGSAYYRLGYQDMMAGVDMLLKRRVADPQRLGIVGHSYGANLTSYAVTQTDRFKAGVVHEATRLDIVDSVLTFPGSTDANGIEYIFGISDPFSEASQKRVIDESPRFHLGRMKTPLLLQFGARSQAGETGEMLYRSLLRLNLPCEFVVYDSGHAVAAPAPAVEEQSRVVAWFDYWLRNFPYPDEVKGRQFSAWQAAKRPSQQRSQ